MMAGLIARTADRLATLERVPQVLLDLPRRTDRMRFASPRRRARDLARRLRAARLVLRLIARAGLPWSCRRTACLIGRTMARAGERPTLHFGMRRVLGGGFEGHVWAGASSKEGDGCASEYPIRVSLPRPKDGWWRG